MKWFFRVVGGLILVGGLAYLAVDYVVNLKMRENLDEEIAELSDRLEVTYDYFRYNLLTGKGRATGLMAAPVDSKMRVVMDELIVHEVKRDATGQVATRLRLEGKGIRLQEKDEFGKYQPGIRSLGYDDPEMKLDFGFKYEPEEEHLVVDTLRLTGESMGALDFTSELSGVQRLNPEALQSGNIVQRMVALGGLKFHGAEIVYEDAGLVERILDQQAEKAGVTREQLVDGITTAMRGFAAVRLPESLVEPVETFLQSPERICVAAKPSKPVGKEQLGLTLLLRGNVLSLFGVEVTN